MFRSLLVGIDNSGASRSVLDLALDLAHQNKASITICTVVNYARVAPAAIDMSGLGSVRMFEILRDDAKRLLADASARAEEMNVAVKALLLDGEPVSQILQLARDSKADLIIVGSHGRRGFYRFMLGSVAEGVLRGSSVPVLVGRHLEATSADATFAKEGQAVCAPL